MEKRFDYVDIAKGIAIVAVVLWHISFSFGEEKLFSVKTILAGGMWHVPVFFVISGFFIKEPSLIKTWSFIKGKLKSLYLFTLFFYVPAVVLHNVFFYVGFYSTEVHYGSKIISTYQWGDFIKNIVAAIFFAGREPIVGPLWFAYVLCLAFIGLALLTFVIRKFFYKYNCEKIRFLICLLFAVISAIFSNKLGLTINRFSNIPTAMLLLVLGQYLFQKKKVSFDSWIVFIAALSLAWQNSVLNGNVYLNDNRFHDIFHVACGSLCALYVVCFVAKRISRTLIGRFLKFVGQKSFYVMALHFLSFKIFAMIIRIFNEECRIDFLIPDSQNDLFLVLGYLSFGVGLPLFVAFVISKMELFFNKSELKCG